MNEYNKKLSKVEVLALSHYARKDIQKAMFDFCKNRETVANFNNKFFAKRPDTFDYPSDIANSARQGATSFHCSEEIWVDPMKINTDMSPSEYNDIRSGWDLLIDIDSKYLDYGKIALKLLIETLEKNGVNNYGIKFSGSKGFHLIVPFKAFPERVGEDFTKDNFPEWPRYIARYLFDSIKDKMNAEIFKLSSREKLIEVGELTTEHLCPKCGNPTAVKTIGKYRCLDIRCKTEVESMKSNRKEMICPTCNGKMIRISKREIQFCDNCKINTAGLEARKSQATFEKKDMLKSQEDSVDFVLVAARHLFRAPYSLHEKTGFASIPIYKTEIENFKPTDADPLKINEIRNFMPEVVFGEAERLLVYAIEQYKQEKPKIEPRKYDGESLDIKGLTITEDMFPPVIKKILEGIKKDGRKRALGILLSFFTSLEFPQEYIEERINEWNLKNYQPIKQGYIKAQISWAMKNKRLPPNYDKPIYKEFGISGPPEPGIKNPINYTLKKAMKSKAKSNWTPQKNNHSI